MLYCIRKHFESAEVAAGLQLSVTGVLGFRTVRQVKIECASFIKLSGSSFLALRLLLHIGRTKGTNGTCCKHKLIQHFWCLPFNKPSHSYTWFFGDASDVFVAPKLLGNSHESESGVQCIHAGGSAAHLKAIQQAVILSRCLLIEKSSRQDEMQSKLFYGWVVRSRLVKCHKTLSILLFNF